ncbi:hypothetical protein Aduo_019035 [Ancylostoma duodenale]
MGEPELQTSLLIAHSASGDRIQLLGQRQCTYSFHDASAQGNSYVANTPSNLLGAEWIVKMGIYALMDCLPSTEPGQQAEINASIADQTSNNVAKQLQRDYPHAFSDKFGLYKMSSATLQLKPGAKPVFRPKRRVPYAAQHAVDKELDRLESIGVISKYRSTTSIGKVDSLFRLIAPQPTTDEDQVSQLYQWMRTSSTYSSIQYEPYQSRLMKTKRQQPTIASSN